MDIADDMKRMTLCLAEKYTFPAIEAFVFPLIFSGAQSTKDCEFMAILLGSNAAGMSYVNIPDELIESYLKLDPADFVGIPITEYCRLFGSDDPIENMIGLAAINAVCQHVMQVTAYDFTEDNDSLGLLDIRHGDRIGMVGFFRPLLHVVQKEGAELVILEEKEELVNQYAHLPLTLNIEELKGCNKVLITGTTVLNHTLDTILQYCDNAEHVTVLGPTAGFFPDPLFERGVDVVGGRYVHDGEQLLESIKKRQPWGEATTKITFDKTRYTSVL